MKKFYSFALVALVAIFTACTYEITESIPTELEIKLKSEVTPASRVADANYQSTQIVEGQQVGVTITGAKNGHINVAWTAGADGSLTNTEEAVYYGNGAATITAYHPYNPDWASTSHLFSVSTDQSTNEGYLASDLLWATATSAKTESPVVLTFAHMLAKINVTLTSTDMTDLSDATISLCGTNIATNFNSETGELSAATTVNVQEIKAGVTTPNALTASAIVIPQTVEAGTKFIKVSHGSKTYYYTLTADKELKSGRSYSYTLTVKEAENELKVKSENIIDWDDETNEGVLEEEVNQQTLLLPDGNTFNSIISSYLENNTHLTKIKFIANSNKTSETILVTDADGTIGYIVENGEYLEIHSSAEEFIANSSCRLMFWGLNKIISIDFGENFYTDNVTDMYAMFDSCHALTSLNVSNFNTRNVKDMTMMFNQCFDLTSLDLSNFNTEKATNMYGMFGSCTALISLDVSNFNTENVSDMSYMFCNCVALESLDVSNFNTENVTNMEKMFYTCYALTSMDLSNFNTENVTNMHGMFGGCTALTSLNISNFNTENVTNMYAMFSGCYALTLLNLSKFNTKKVTNMNMMFNCCYALTSLDLLSFSFENNVITNKMFSLVGTDAPNKPISIKITPEAYTYLMETMYNNCNISSVHAKFVKSDGSDW